MRRIDAAEVAAGAGALPDRAATPLVIATILREDGVTGVHTHFRQLRRYLEGEGTPAELVTAFSWGGLLSTVVYGVRLILERFSGAASVWWYRHWHELFLRVALRRRLARVGECVVYAQCPLSAGAALLARVGPHQRVVMAVHFRTSQADEWADKGDIPRGGHLFGSIRALESDVVPRVDGLVYVSHWARESLVGWLPAAAAVPYVVFDNFVAPMDVPAQARPAADLVTLGNLEPVKNHRYLLQVLAEARSLGRAYTLDIFGTGPLRRQTELLAASLGVADLVRLRGFRADVRTLLPGYRAYVHASYSESSSLAVIEAMCARLPIVAGDIGPLAELFDEGVEGRFWPLGDPTAAARVLIGLLDDERGRAEAAKAAASRFRRDYTADVVAPRLMSFVMNGTVAARRPAVAE